MSDVAEERELRKLWNTVIKPEAWISSGSVLLDLACSGLPHGCIFAGGYFWIVGDSSSGKTVVALRMLAEASINPHFDDYDLIFDNIEGGALMDIEEFYGEKLADRLQAPKIVDGKSTHSHTLEEVYFNIDRLLKKIEQKKSDARKFIYLVDSVDATTTNYERAKFDEASTAFEKGKEATGDFGDGKAKIHSRWMRDMVFRLAKSGCIAIFLSQTRDNIGGERWEPDKVVAGGHALKFYAAFQLWTSLGAKLTKDVNEKARQIGITSRISIKKNRLTGKEWTIEVPIYWSVGVDDIGSQLDFIIDEKHWKSSSSKRTVTETITAPEFEFEGRKITLLRKIENENLEEKLKEIVVQVWRKIEDACRVSRKKKY